MVNFLSVLFALFSINSFAAVVPSGVPNFKFGATTLTPDGLGSVSIYDVNATVGGVFSLYMSTEGTVTAGNVSPFYRDGVAYQVPALTSAYCTGVYMSDTTLTNFQLMSATASFASNATPGSLTGPAYQTGFSNRYVYEVLTAKINEYQPMNGFYRFKAGTYPGVQMDLAAFAYVNLTCYEKLD